MCGRFSLTISIEMLNEYFNLAKSIVMKPRYNIAPGEPIPIIKTMGELEFLHWGLTPSFKNSQKFINACSETILEKPSFRQAFKMRRCLVIADGFYEWKPIGKIKQPYYIRRKDKMPFAMAGIWEGESVAIITRSATADLSTIHKRMPVIISKNNYEAWLNPKLDVKQNICPLLHSLVIDPWEIVPVSTRVNHAAFDHPECIRSLH